MNEGNSPRPPDRPSQDQDDAARVGVTSSLQDGAGQGYASLATLLSGMLVWGGAGALLDLWLGTHVLLAVGVIVGLACSVYLVYLRSAPSPPV